MQKQHNTGSKTSGRPWFALGVLSLFMLVGIAGGFDFFSAGQIGAGLVFAGMFCGISGLMMFLLLHGQNQTLAEQAMLQGQAPAAGIASNNKTGYQVMLGMGVVFLGFGVPISYLALSDELPKGNYVVLLVLLFPLVGALLIWQGRRTMQHWQKIGKTPFFAEPFPGNAGGQVGGYFTLQHGRFAQMPQAELSCLHVYQSGSGKDRTTHRQPLWHSQAVVSRSVDGKHWLVLDVPAELPASGKDARYKGRIEWQLSCNGELQQGSERLKFSRQWTLPVISGTARCVWQPHASEVALQQQQRQVAAFDAAASQILQQVQGDSLRLVSKAGRHTGTALVLMLFGAIFTGSGVFLSFEAMRQGGMLWLMALTFTPIGLLILCYGLFWLGRGLKAGIAPGTVQMQRAMFGITLYQRQAALSNAEQLQIKQTMVSTNSENQRTEYYCLQAKADGKTLLLAEGITGRDAAEALKQQVLEALLR
ncbi:hypothetical protein HRH59_13255 [Rheinheimera sp. YQF-2]|uniref:DUF3592 domain-containing protein n=1 Tax=Rheinheimera lutimaris TaxID=2740584 RepID=A0A7Y5EIG8_9GAMM|nr:hypothetical protein [Rheinheimera lutimaris]NRQ43515.1 hypothetical protein [Rheinheimera lutimaris]